MSYFFPRIVVVVSMFVTSRRTCGRKRSLELSALVIGARTGLWLTS